MIIFDKEMYLFGKYIDKSLVKYEQGVLYESRRSIYFASEILKERKETIKEERGKKRDCVK